MLGKMQNRGLLGIRTRPLAPDVALVHLHKSSFGCGLLAQTAMYSCAHFTLYTGYCPPLHG